MKKIVIALLLLFPTFIVRAQMSFPGKENAHTILGGEDGKNFAAIFSMSGSSRQNSIEKVIDFLASKGFVSDKDKAYNLLKEYDDTQSEFTFPVSFRFGWHGTAPIMGAVGSLPPVILKADLLFQFYDNGKVRLIIKNLEDYAFVEYAYNIQENVGKIMATDYLTEEEQEEYTLYMQSPAMKDGLGKAFTAILVWGNAGLDRMDDFYKEWDAKLEDIDNQIKIAQKMADNGYYLFTNGQGMVEAYQELIDSGKAGNRINQSLLDKNKQELAEGRMLFLYPRFWNRDVKQEFDYVFIAVNQFLGGEIEGIAEDGELTWELVDGKLLPVDAKLRKKLEKKGQDYFSYIE